MNKYKLICSDVDGTLLDINRALSTSTIAQIKRVKEQIPVVLISSRMPKSMRILQNQLDIANHPLIAYNGSLILDNNEELFSAEIDASITKRIVDFCSGTEVHLSLYHKDEWFVPKMDFWAKRETNNTKVEPIINDLKSTLFHLSDQGKGCHKIMCMGDENEISLLHQNLLKEFKDKLNIYRSKPTYLEISDINQDKASAMRLLLEMKYENYSMENVVAFGDNYNDLSLIKEAGLGIAVANAKSEVLDIADYIAASNIEDGVAVEIKRLF